MGEPQNLDCNHGIPPGFEPEIYIENSEIFRCYAYLLSVERQCRRMASGDDMYCGWHDQPLAIRGCSICKKTRMVKASIERKRKQAEALQRKKRAPGKPTEPYRLTNAERKQVKNQREQRDMHDFQLMEAVSMLDEHLSNSGGKEFDRGLELALDGDVAKGILIMKKARKQMNAQSFPDSAMLDLIEKPRQPLEVGGAVSGGMVLDVMSDFLSLALRAIPSDSGRAWFIGKLRGKFGKAASQ